MVLEWRIDMKNETIKWKITLFSFFMVLPLVFIDQITKYFARVKLADGPCELIPGVFSFTYLENAGSVWGIMQGKTIFLIIISLIMLAALVFFLYKLPLTKRFMPLRIVLIFLTAGAIGNLIDRISTGVVTDFFYFELIDFPIFNVADIYITVSEIVLILLILFYYKDEDFQWKKSNLK